ETRRCHRLLGAQAEFDDIEEQLQRRLVLAVAAGHADGERRPAVLQSERWRERDAWTLAGLNAVGMARPGVEALQPAAEPDPRVADQHATEAAGRRRHNIALAIGDQA